MPDSNLNEVLALLAENSDTQAQSLAWASHAGSHVGRVRKTNEDAYIELGNEGLWAVADGMGGHSRGDHASMLVVQALESFTRPDRLTHGLKNIDARLQSANTECQKAFEGEKTGSTVAALFQHGGKCCCIWAGDSRVYRLRDNELTMLTHDHSVAQERHARGELSAIQAALHPGAHVLTRAVGIHKHLRLSYLLESAQANDRYLLCTDGLYNKLSLHRIAKLLGEAPLPSALNNLIHYALDENGSDNITAIAVEAKAN